MRPTLFAIFILLNSLLFAAQIDFALEINNLNLQLETVNRTENVKDQIQQIFKSSAFDYFSKETIERYATVLSVDLSTDQTKQVLFEMSTYDLALQRDWGDLAHVSIPVTKTASIPLAAREQSVINEIIADLRYDEQNLENSQLSPSIAVVSNGNIVLVWKEIENDQDILFLQQFDNNANEKNEIVQVCVQDRASIRMPVAAINSNGSILVSWFDKHNNECDLKGRLLNSNGIFVGQEIVISSNINSNSKLYSPQIKIDQEDNFAVLWYNNTNDRFDLMAQHMNAGGQLLGNSYAAGANVTPSTSFIGSVEKTFTSWNQNRISVENKILSTTQLAGINLMFNQIDDSNFPNIVSYVSVQDAYGDPVQGMSSSHFYVSENSRTCSPIQVSPVGTSSSGADFVLVIDRSGSMDGQPLQDAKDAATIFINQLTSNDRAAVISFDDVVRVEQNLTSSKSALINAVNRLTDGGATSHYDAVMEAIDLIGGSNRRKAIVSLTDGYDNSSNADVYDCIHQANVKSIPVFTIGLYNGHINRTELNRMATDTGGHYYEPATRQDLLDIYQQIAILIHNQYRISYTSPNTLEDCTERSVYISANYYGSSDSGSKSYMAPCGPVYQPNFYIKLCDPFPSVCPTTPFDHDVIISNKIGPAQQDVTVCIYASRDRDISKTDYKLGCITATPNDFGHRNYCTVTIHCDPSALEPGTYYFGVKIDPYGEIDESNEDDNEFCSSSPTQMPQTDYVKVTTPNGGESWECGKQYAIQWEKYGSGNVRIELLKGSSSYHTISSSTSNDGYYSWSIPSSYDAAGNYIVKITSTSNSSITDKSDDYFSLKKSYTMSVTTPNGGEDWQLGSSHTIYWTSNAGGNVKINLMRNGSYYQTITSSTSNDGRYTWAIPSNYSESDYYKIKITSTSDASLSDESNGYFSLTAPKSLTVTSPNGGESWELGSRHSITWNSNAGGNVKIHLFKQGSLYSIITSSTANDGSYSWSIPSSYDEYSSYRISITSTTNSSITDYSDNYFSLSASKSIIITSPNGRETWEQGSGHSITWNSNAGGNVKIELYKQNSYYKTITSSTPNDGTMSWAIPSSYDVYSSYRIKISSLTDNSLYDYSDAYFEISAAKSLVVTSPNGGEDWELGSTRTLKWTSNAGGSVKIHLFKESTFYKEISASTSNDGSYSWTIPEDCGEYIFYRIRISSTSNSSIYDYSDNYFRISKPATAEKQVWPGDSNNNGYVDQADVLPIGLYFGFTGQQRSERGNQWRGCCISNWSNEAAGYADCDGSGKVDQADILAIGLNWHKSHAALAKLYTDIPTNKCLALELQSGIDKIGQYVDISLDKADDLMGISFELNLNLNNGQCGAIRYLGAFESDIIHYENIKNDQVAIGVVSLNKSVTSVNNPKICRVYYRGQLNEDGIELGNVRGMNFDGESLSAINDVYTLAASQIVAPSELKLYPNYPNPFNPVTTIRYEVPEEGIVRLEILNVKGEVVRTLVNQQQAAGSQIVQWDGQDDNNGNVSSGIYFCRVCAGSSVKMIKMILTH